MSSTSNGLAATPIRVRRQRHLTLRLAPVVVRLHAAAYVLRVPSEREDRTAASIRFASAAGISVPQRRPQKTDTSFFCGSRRWAVSSSCPGNVARQSALRDRSIHRAELDGRQHDQRPIRPATQRRRTAAQSNRFAGQIGLGRRPRGLHRAPTVTPLLHRTDLCYDKSALFSPPIGGARPGVCGSK